LDTSAAPRRTGVGSEPLQGRGECRQVEGPHVIDYVSAHARQMRRPRLAQPEMGYKQRNIVERALNTLSPARQLISSPAILGVLRVVRGATRCGRPCCVR
jgi:hypothetical protein